MFSKYSAGLKNPGNNAQFKDELCYTEDNILVYNLYIGNIPEDISEDDIKDKFSQYGEILSVNIQVKKKVENRSNYRYGFVNFASASSASEALRKKILLPYTYRSFVIKPADSWKQSGILEQDSQESEIQPLKRILKEDEIDENSILKLNDDCLIQIFSLFSLKEQITLSRVCERFLSIFQIIFRKYKSLNIANDDENLTLMETRHLTFHVSRYIEEAKLLNQRSSNRKTNFSRFLNFILQSCKNLRCLKIFNIESIHPNIYKKFSTNLKYLKVVELRNCSINDDVCNYLSQLPMLQTLDISGNSQLTGKFLSKFPKLIQLNLNGCSGIQPKLFSALCKRRKLKSLNIRNCYKLNERNFREMETTLQNLASLIIGNNYRTNDLYHIANLKNLTELIIYGGNRPALEDYLFELLATTKGNNLQTLILKEIHLNNNRKECINSLKGLRNLGLFKLQLYDDFLEKLANLPNLINLSLAGCYLPNTERSLSLFFKGSNTLSYIDISYCTGFERSDLYDILENVKKLKRSTTPCTLYMSDLPLREYFLVHEKYVECASYLPILDQKSELTKKFFDSDTPHLPMGSFESVVAARLRNLPGVGFMRRPNYIRALII